MCETEKVKKKIMTNEDRQKIRLYNKRYYANNRDRCNELSRKYYNNHKEEIKKEKRKYYQTHKEERKNYGKKYRQNHKIEKKECNIKYYQNHPEKRKEHYNNQIKYRKEYDLNHRVEINKRQKEYCKTRYKIDARFRLTRIISVAINKSLHGNKKGHHSEDLLGYTVEDLKRHLESQFTEDMDWSNYGLWEIDHRIPISAFNFSSSEHQDFRRCWALSNLQPMWKSENKIKSDKLKESFQPNLAL